MRSATSGNMPNTIDGRGHHYRCISSLALENQKRSMIDLPAESNPRHLLFSICLHDALSARVNGSRTREDAVRPLTFERNLVAPVFFYLPCCSFEPAASFECILDPELERSLTDFLDR